MLRTILDIFGKFSIIVWMVLQLFGGSDGLRDVRVSIPEAVPSGEAAVLHCRYDLEHDQLYSFKWYKNKHEFFRYIPKELPHTKVFPLPGVDVDMHRSGPGTLVLRAVSSSISDRYRCEVIADAPTYRTLMKSGYMHVVDVPKTLPQIAAEKSRIVPGELLIARCVAPATYPPANITWTLNGYKINATKIEHISEQNIYEVLNNFTQNEEKSQEFIPSFRKTQGGNVPNKFEQTRSDQLSSQSKHETSILKPRKHEPGNREKKMTVSSLTVRVERELSRHNRLKLACTANIFNIYNKKVEVMLDIERPHSASILVMATGINAGDCVTNHASLGFITTVINFLINYYCAID